MLNVEISQTKQFTMSIILFTFAYQKRSNVRDCRTRLHSLIIKLENYDMYKDIWTIEKITKELKEINKELIKSAEKYDYSKLPKDNS